MVMVDSGQWQIAARWYAISLRAFSMYNFPNLIKEIKALMISNLSKATQLVSVEGRVQTQVRLCLTTHASSLSVPPLKSTSLTLNHIPTFSHEPLSDFAQPPQKFSTAHSWTYHLLGHLCSPSVFPFQCLASAFWLNLKVVTVELPAVVRSPSLLLSDSLFSWFPLSLPSSWVTFSQSLA